MNDATGTVSGSVLSLAEPQRLWWMIALLVIVVGGWAFERARHAATVRKLGDRGVLGQMLASASPRRRAIKMVLQLLAGALLVVAIAEPQRAAMEEVGQRGLDIVIAMDVSKSMLVQDVAPDRLARARELALQTLDGLPGDRSAAVVFADSAAKFPLTDDHEVTAQFLNDLGPADLRPGSNLAEAIRAARCILRPDSGTQLGCRRERRGHGGDPLPGDRDDFRDDDVVIESEERGRAIVVFTDGGDPDDDTRQQVAIARDLGIALFVVGVGTTAGGEVWDIDDAGRRTRVKRVDGKPVISKRNDDGLAELAALGGDQSRYMVGTEQGTPDARGLVSALNAVQRGVVKRTMRRRRGVQLGLLFPAFALLLIEAVIGTRRRLATPDGSPLPVETARDSRNDVMISNVELGRGLAPRRLAALVGVGGYLATIVLLIIYHKVANPRHNGFTSGEMLVAAVMLLVCGVGAWLSLRWQQRRGSP